MTSARDPSQAIGLLGGSFNPAHEGHLGISLAALARLGLDRVWWLVTPGNPLKDPRAYAPYEDRLAAARRIANDPRIAVLDFEARRNLQYTADTLEALRSRHPAHRFVWLMGADSLRDFDQWRDWRRIAQTVPIAVFNRPGLADAALRSETARALKANRIDEAAAETLADTPPPAWVFITDTDIPVSSTAIRNAAPAKGNRAAP